MRLHHLAILTFAVPLALTAGNQQQVPVAFADDSGAPIAQAPPEYGIGTTFVINLTINGETVVNTDTLVEKIDRGGRTLDVYENSAAPIVYPGDPCDGQTHVVLDSETRSWAGCMADGKFLAQVQPHNGRFAWPLEVGNKWRTTQRWVDHVVHPSWSGEYSTDFEVLAYEEVEVPAGRFMAFKVGTTKTPGDDGYENIWYAPDVGSFVKIMWGRTKDTGYGRLEGLWELVSVDIK